MDPNKQRLGGVVAKARPPTNHLVPSSYSEERRKSVKLQQPYVQEEEEIVGRYLFENKDIEEAKTEITSFWKIRERIRKEREKQK